MSLCASFPHRHVFVAVRLSISGKGLIGEASSFQFLESLWKLNCFFRACTVPVDKSSGEAVCRSLGRILMGWGGMRKAMDPGPNLHWVKRPGSVRTAGSPRTGLYRAGAGSCSCTFWQSADPIWSS